MTEETVYYKLSDDLDLGAKVRYIIRDNRYGVTVWPTAQRGTWSVAVIDWERGVQVVDEMESEDVWEFFEFFDIDWGNAAKWYKPMDFLYADERDEAPASHSGYGRRYDRQSYVYFILDQEHGLVKIGKSVYPTSRLQELQRMTRATLVMLKCIHGNRDTEQELHRRFSGLREHHEWFNYSGELKDFIDSLPEDPDEEDSD